MLLLPSYFFMNLTILSPKSFDKKKSTFKTELFSDSELLSDNVVHYSVMYVVSAVTVNPRCLISTDFDMMSRNL